MANFVDSADDTNLYWLVAHLDDVQRAECSPGDAAKVLSLAAEYLRKGEVVPAPLAIFIAAAFERAIAANEEKRAQELAHGLRLSSSNRRPKVSENELGCWVFRQLADNPEKTLTAVLTDAAKVHGIGKTTASDHWEKWKPKNKVAIDVLRKTRQTI